MRNMALREFLISRRRRLTPDAVGLPAQTGVRRVTGLRRDEVAHLAGISTSYYKRLELGVVSEASPSVVDALAEALRLGAVERRYLDDLVRMRSRHHAHPAREGAAPVVRQSVARVLGAIDAPAIAYDFRQDVVAANAMGRALYSPVLDAPAGGFNLARFTFLDPRAREFYTDWDESCRLNSGMLRMQVASNPSDARLAALVEELSAKSAAFRENWADHTLHVHRSGRKVLQQPEVGIIDITYDVLEMPGEPGLATVTYTAAPGSESADALDRLAAYAARCQFEDFMSRA